MQGMQKNIMTLYAQINEGDVMYHKLNSKLRSQTGASITIALLLFLVCAVIGSVVLAAGTTAGGRFSELSEMDQRYYSVTSAAELLGKELDGQKVTIVRTRKNTKTETTPYIIDTTSDVNTVTAGNKGTIDKYDFSTIAFENTDTTNTSFSRVSTDIDGSSTDFKGDSSSPNPETEKSLLTACALSLLFGGNPCNTNVAMSYTMGNSLSQTDFTLTHGNGKEDLKISGKYELKNDGTLIFTFWNDNDSDPYTMRLTMNAAVKESEETSSSSNSVKDETDPSVAFKEIVTTTTTTTKTSEITWTFGGIEKA